MIINNHIPENETPQQAKETPEKKPAAKPVAKKAPAKKPVAKKEA